MHTTTRTAAILLLTGLVAMGTRGSAATFVVNSTGDDLDWNIGDGVAEAQFGGSGITTLRSAIEESVATTGPHTITFSIGSGHQVIQPLSVYSALSNQVTIDGTTQPGYVSGLPVIEIDGSLLSSSDGFSCVADGCIVRGLVINGFGGNGVSISASNCRVETCFLGTDQGGAVAVPNGLSGVLIGSGSNNVVGGTGAARNVIAYNGGDGILVYPSGSGVNIRGNSIHTNGGLGIDLWPDGVTANDANDDDTLGPNNLQNFPLLLGAYTTGSATVAKFTLDSSVGNAAYPVMVDFFANAAADPSGYGEGEQYLGSTLVTGPGTWDATGLLPCFVGQTLAATATDYSGNSSEFSGGILVGDPPTTVTNTSDSGYGSLREAILFANANPGSTIALNILTNDPGYAGGAFTIQPTSALPAVTADGTVIDGATQTAFTGDTNAAGPEVVVNGSLASGADGLKLTAANCVVRSLVISGWAGNGISIEGNSATGNLVTGCYIGTDGNGTVAPGLGNGWHGVGLLSGAHDNFVGEAGYGNTLAGNNRAGVYVDGGVGNLISQNAIHANAYLGIDLHDPADAAPGVTPNDPGDTDSGSNNLVNFPELLAIHTNAGTTTIEGRVDLGPAASSARVELFLNDAVDPADNGYGEGKQYVGDAYPDTNGYFTAALSALPGGQYVTATTIDLNNNTSEFSKSLQVGSEVPADYGDANGPYATLLANDGARHFTEAGLFLGAAFDLENDGQPTPGADGDDTNGATPDDEDGVAFLTPMAPGTTAKISVTVTGSGYLAGWVDFGHDGVWDDQDEHVVWDEPLSDTGNPHELTVAVPSGAILGNTFARFRFSSTGGLSPTGPALDGEVEDYQVAIGGQVDFGDAPDPAYPTLKLNDGARHTVWKGTPANDVYLGTDVDPDTDGQPTANADGDTNDDGVTIPTLRPGQPTDLTVNVVGDGNLNGWIDFDGDGVWNDQEEHVVWDVPLSATGNPHTVAISSVPAAAKLGKTFARFRYSTEYGLQPNGYAPDGEVEDYEVSVGGDPDYGDAPYDGTTYRYPTAAINNGAMHSIVAGLHLGAEVDAEADGHPSLDAKGDDNDGVPNDEDGVLSATSLIPNTTASIDIVHAGDGYLQGWIDFNRDGDWDDPGEQAIPDHPLQGIGTKTVTFPVPMDADPGPTYARLRFSTQQYLPADGYAPDGEVEDYRVEISGPKVTHTNESGAGSLRDAILFANANPAATITFAISTSDPGYNPTTQVARIAPTTPLPQLECASTKIDGQTQKAFVGSTQPWPGVELAGGNVGQPNSDGLVVGAYADSCELRGLTVNAFSGNGLVLLGDQAAVYGCQIGTDAQGQAASSPPNGGSGIVIEAHNALIGDANGAPGPINFVLVSGNAQNGVAVQNGATGANLRNCFIGLSRSGKVAVGNGENGVLVTGGANGNQIGGTDGAGYTDGCTLSGNTGDGVRIDGSGSDYNVVRLCNIGGKNDNLDLNGTVPNQGNGVTINGGAQHNSVGDPGNALGNVIFGNGGNGVHLAGAGTSFNKVKLNFIGPGASGATTGQGNTLYGVLVETSASENLIGGPTAAEQNVIAGNTGGGISVSAATYTTVQGNFVGVDVTGTMNLRNGGHGITVASSSDTVIGGNTAVPGTAPGNVISADNEGLHLLNAGTSNNTIQGNAIGVAADGTTVLGCTHGIDLKAGGSNTRIGGTNPGDGNHIAHCTGIGIALWGAPQSAGLGNQLLGNSLHDNGSLGIDLGKDGVTTNSSSGSGTDPNHFQQYPVLTSVQTDGSSTTIEGTLDSLNGYPMTLELFVSAAADPSGYGEGKDHLDWVSVSASGPFSTTVPLGLTPGHVVTATATDDAGNTSEFGLAVEVNAAPVIVLGGAPVDYAENDPPIVLAAAATVTDANSANFAGGTLSAQFAYGGTTEDRLGVRNEGTGAGQIGVSSNNVTYGGTLIGAVFGGHDGATPLAVNLNASATPAATQAVLRNLTYENVSQSPDTTQRQIEFALTDGDGGLSNQPVRAVNVTAVNDPPVMAVSAGLTVPEGGTEPLCDTELKATDVDLPAQTLTFTVGTAPANGKLLKSGESQLGAGGSFTQDDLDGGLLSYAHNGGETTTDSFTFTVSDGNSGTIPSTTFTITVTPVNDPPVAANDGPYAALQGKELTVPAPGLLQNDTDAENASLSSVWASDPANGTLSLGTDGLFTYASNPFFTGTDTFTYKASDGQEYSEEATVTLSVGVVYDFGDAPDAAGSPKYPTLLANNGARHGLSALRLGAADTDSETDGQPTTGADGDDLSATADEDGVGFASPLSVGQSATVAVTASGAGKLDAWVDFNADGDWLDTGERIFSAKPVVAGLQSLSYSVPSSGKVGTTYARFRLSSAGTPSPGGLAVDGEVEDYQVSLVPGAAASLVFTVQPTTAVAGVALTPAIKVEIRDAFGNLNTAATSPVTLEVGTNPAAGTLSGTTTVTATAGVASFAGLSLNKAGTGYTLKAKATGLPDAASSAFNITPAAARKLAFTQQPTNAAAGAALSPAVKVAIQDEFGNTVTGATNAVTTALDANPGGSALSGTTTANAVAGVATFSTLKLNKVGSGYTLKAMVTGLPDVASAAFDVTPGAAALLEIVSGDGQSGAKGQPLPEPFVVRVTDGWANPVSGAQLSFTVTAGAGTLEGQPAVTRPSGADGKASATLTLGTAAAHEVAVALPNATPVTFVASLRSADLGLKKTVDNTTPTLGQEVTYTLTVTNQSLDTAATGVRITDALPAGVAYVRHDSGPDYDPMSGVWNVGDVPAGGSAFVGITARVELGTGGQTITNTATITSADQADPNPDNDSDDAALTVQAADLELTKVATPEPVQAGESLTYTLTVKNTGPSPATGLKVVDTLPAAVITVSTQSAAGTCELRTNGEGRQEVVWTLARLAVGATVTVTLVVEPTKVGALTNEATVSALEADPNEKNNRALAETTVAAGKPAELLLTADSTRAEVGDSVTVTASVFDKPGNAVPGVAVTLTVTAGDGSLTLPSRLPASNTDENGALEARLEPVSLGANTVKAEVTGLDPKTLDILGEWRLTLSAGRQILTIPFKDLSPADAAELLGIPGEHLKLATYDPVVEKYVTYREQPFGFAWARGYFGKFDTERTVAVSQGTPVTDCTQPVAVLFADQGWQLFGNPFTQALDWNLEKIQLLDNGKNKGALSTLLSGEDALTRSAEPYMWVYDHLDANDPYRLLWDTHYKENLPEVLRDRAVSRLEAGQGAFALLNKPNSGYSFTCAVRSAVSVGSAAAPASAEGDWALPLVLQSGELRDGANAWGVRTRAANGFQLAEPPVIENSDGAYLSLGFAPPQQGKWRMATGSGRAALLAADVRAGIGTKADWEVVARTNRSAASADLSWPDLSSLPRRYRAYLVDLETGARQAMRTTTSFRFRTNAQGPTERRFRIEVDATAQSRLQLTNVTVVPSGRGAGLSVAFTLSQPARVQLALKNSVGRPVYVGGPYESAAGAGAVELTGRTASAQPLTRGVYLLELIAQADTGERFRVVRPVPVR